MNIILNKAKELFDKVKPVIMSEETSTTEAPKVTVAVNNETANNAADVVIETDAKRLSTPKTTPLNMISAIINGGGVGLLLGLLLGLAISPVVSGIIGTLSGLLAVLLGINEKYITPLKSIRIGAFGFFCVAGILYGMYVRTNKGLLPSREKMMEEYIKVGFTQQQARDFIVYREFNLVPLSWKGSGSANNIADNSEETEAVDNTTLPEINNNTATTETDTQEKVSSPVKKENTNKVASKREVASTYVLSDKETGAERLNVLYASEIDGGQCYILNETSPDMEVRIIKNNFTNARGTWKELADLDKDFPEAVYVKALFDLRDVFCTVSNGRKIKIPKNAAVSKINAGQSIGDIKKILTAAGDTWKMIVASISSNIPEEYQKKLFISVAKILSHD